MKKLILIGTMGAMLFANTALVFAATVDTNSTYNASSVYQPQTLDPRA